jgi:Ca2+-binding EF-hand superfamily protein
MDKNNNGQVTADEFKAYFQGQPKFKLDPNNLNELFKALDTQNRGFIDLQQLVAGFRDKIDIAIL